MPRKKKPSTGTEYCSGFVDEHGQWNNGFYCPKWGGTDLKYCCGPEDHKYCCPKEESTQPLSMVTPKLHVNLVIGLALGSFVLVIATLFLSCFFCRCCWAYKRRKRLQILNTGFTSGRMMQNAGRPNYAVSYSVCPHGTLLPEFMMPAPRYPSDDPPPYPGGPSIPLEEKQPLRELEIHPGQDTPQQRRSDHHGAFPHDGESKSSSPIDTSPLPAKAGGPFSQREGGIMGDEQPGARDSPWPRPADVAADEMDASGKAPRAVSPSPQPDCRPGTSTQYCSGTWPLSKSGINNKMREMGECGPAILDSLSSSSGSYTG